MKFASVTTLCVALLTLGCASITYRKMQIAEEYQAREVLSATSSHVVAAVRIVFESAVGVLGATQDTFMSFQDQGVTDPKAFDAVLKRVIDSDRFGAWLVWDGSDAPKATRDAHSNLAIYWHQNGMEMVRESVPQEIYESPLYQIPIQSDQSYLLEPHAIDAMNGDPTLVTSFSQPLEHDGKVVGALAVDIKLDAISSALSAIKLPNGASIAVVSDGGIVAMSSDGQHIGKPIDTLEKTFKDLYKTAKLGQGAASGLATSENSKSFSSAVRIRFAGVRNPWFLLLKMPDPSFLAASPADGLFLIALFAATMFLSLAIVLAAMNWIVARPLAGLSAIINGLGSGLFAFDVNGSDRSDEIGDIARAVVRLQQNSMDIARLQEANGENEYQREIKRRNELNAISTCFSRSIEATVIVLAEVSDTVERRSRDVYSATDAAVQLLRKVSFAAIEAKTGMASAAALTSSVVASADSIGERTRQGRSASQEVEQKAGSAALSIRELKQTIGSAEAIATSIQKVAAQINLISLNATIEAARAGTSGRGFAVVAHEIKLLAVQMSKATEEISAHNSAIRQALGLTEVDVLQMYDAFGRMRAISTGIMSSLDTQLLATEEISGVVGNATERADRVARGVDQLVESAREVTNSSDVMLKQCGVLSSELERLKDEVGVFLQSLAA